MLLVIVYSGMAIASSEHSSAGFAGLLTFAVAILTLSGFGVVLQTWKKQFESKLFRRRHDPSNIITFAFSFGKRAQVSLEKHKLSFRATTGLDATMRSSIDYKQSVEQ